ncbi:hypothetical protein 4 [Beihai picorna-like virus 120]|uniref:hypothetical protein 4 n=1 Tax=Beihai picorna-like virus 120 TaxID=1922549 RepID=UPI000909530D|nr:hypothetical protein 4 [Beihai picorna-like virus 120]APG76876.1 hypothetical protein 4 [Beihai picorna-like virus 120]
MAAVAADAAAGEASAGAEGGSSGISQGASNIAGGLMKGAFGLIGQRVGADLQLRNFKAEGDYLQNSFQSAGLPGVLAFANGGSSLPIMNQRIGQTGLNTLQINSFTPYTGTLAQNMFHVGKLW